MADVITLQEFYRKAGVKDAHKLDFAKYITLEKDPWKHQISGLNEALANERYGLYDEPGCGKTLPAQAWVLYYAHWGNRCVVVMPPTLLEQFKESLEGDFHGLNKWFRWHLLDEGPYARLELYGEWEKDKWPDILLMSYQMFLKEKDTLKKRDYCVVLADEAHVLKNIESKTHQAVFEAVGGDEKGKGALLTLTGTPTPNTLMDAYAMGQILDRTTYWTQRYFEKQFCVMVGPPRRKKLVGFQNQDQLHKQMYKLARRVTKKDVFPDLKEPIITEVPVTLSKKHKALYDKLVLERMLEVDGELIDAILAQSLRQKCLRMVACPDQFLDTGKKVENNVIKTVDTLLDSIGVKVQDKCILFCFYRETVDLLTKHYEALNPAVLYGGTTRGKRDTQRKKFLNHSTCRLLIANIESGGVGLNLQDVCKYAIFVEPHSVPGKFKQAAERIYRAGQTEVCTIWIIKALGTSAVKITRSMLRKERDIIAVNRDRTTMFKELMGKD